MFKIPSLSHLILKDMSAREIYQNYDTNLIIIEREFGKRLISSRVEDYLPIIDLLYEKRHEMKGQKLLASVYVNHGLKTRLNTLPWKIGVIYSYLGAGMGVNNIQVILGDSGYSYDGGRRFKDNWWTAQKEHKVLREVVSRYNDVKDGRSLRTVDPRLDNEIRDEILSNNLVRIDLQNFTTRESFNSFPNQGFLSTMERKEVWPIRFTSPRLSVPIFIPSHNMIPGEVRSYDVNVFRAPEINKLLKLLNLISR